MTMMAIQIADAETIALVERLAKALGSNKTAAVKLGMREALESRGQPTTIEIPKVQGGLQAQLLARVRRDTVDYVRLLEKASGKKSGTRIYGMLKRHGVVETLRRLIVGGPTQGLRFLAEQDQLQLAAECAALDPAYESLIPADVRKRAQENLDYARQIIQRRMG